MLYWRMSRVCDHGRPNTCVISLKQGHNCQKKTRQKSMKKKAKVMTSYIGLVTISFKVRDNLVTAII